MDNMKFWSPFFKNDFLILIVTIKSVLVSIYSKYLKSLLSTQTI